MTAEPSIPGVTAAGPVAGTPPASPNAPAGYWAVTYVNPTLGTAAGGKNGPGNVGGQIGGVEDMTVVGPYKTQAEAKAAAQGQLGSSVDIVNVEGPYATQTAAQAVVTQATQQVNKEQSAGSIPNPLSGLAAIGAFFAALAEGNLWIRVAKVVAGGVILIVGLAKLTGLDAKAGGIVQTAVKAAPLL
jgi:hypothetical protein